MFTVVTEVPAQRPEGELIAAALEAHQPKLSARKAAEMAGMSDGRWRQIVNGYQNAGAGNYIPVRAPAETIARMADVVGLNPEQLMEAGRGDAAQELHDLRRNRSVAFPVGSAGDPVDLTKLSVAELEAVKAVIRAMRSGNGGN
jgi:hypothetical protein